MSKSKSTDTSIVLDRTENGETWDQVIAESKLAIKRLKESIKFFEDQKANGTPYPGKHQSTAS